MKKQKSSALGKDVYLLGIDKDYIKYWLEAPSWDCDWYWGFGYIETYERNREPSKALDIDSHEHADNFMAWVIEWNGKVPRLQDTVLTDAEKWEMCELFKRFYLFKDMAEYYNGGGCGVTTLGDYNIKKDHKERDRINKEVLPEIMNRIISLLEPTEK